MYKSWEKNGRVNLLEYTNKTYTFILDHIRIYMLTFHASMGCNTSHTNLLFLLSNPYDLHTECQPNLTTLRGMPLNKFHHIFNISWMELKGYLCRRGLCYCQKPQGGFCNLSFNFLSNITGIHLYAILKITNNWCMTSCHQESW